jgi:hypothetical protein
MILFKWSAPLGYPVEVLVQILPTFWIKLARSSIVTKSHHWIMIYTVRQRVRVRETTAGIEVSIEPENYAANLSPSFCSIQGARQRHNNACSSIMETVR